MYRFPVAARVAALNVVRMFLSHVGQFNLMIGEQELRAVGYAKEEKP